METTVKHEPVSRWRCLGQYFDLVLHEIRDELAKWRVILAVPYQEYLLGE